MRTEAVLVAETPGRELVAAASVVPIDEPHHLRGAVPVVVLSSRPSAYGRSQSRKRKNTYGRTEGPVGDVPAPAEDEEVGEGRAGRLRLRGEHAEDGGVHVVLVDAPDVRELLHGVFIGHVALGRLVLGCTGTRDGGYLLAPPGDDVEWGVLLVAGVQLSADLVDDWCRS